MSDNMCIACGHSPHMINKCARCECNQYQNADLLLARSAVQINNLLVVELRSVRQAIIDLVDIAICLNPDVEDKVIAKRTAELKRQEEENAKVKEEDAKDSPDDDSPSPS